MRARSRGLSATFTVVGTRPDIALGTGTLSLGTPTAASGSCSPPAVTIVGGSYSAMLITPNGLETDSGLFDLTATPTGFTLRFYPPAPSDTTPPVITPTVTSPVGTHGWYTGDVTVAWSVADPESDVASKTGCGGTSITTDTSGTTLTCSATNGAGLSSSASVTIKRDATPRTIVHVVLPASRDGANGWYKSAPIVTFSCEDTMSGIASYVADGEAGPSKTVGESASAQTVPGTAADNAGNTAHDSATGLLVDLSDPRVECTTGATLGDPRSVDAPGESITFDFTAVKPEYEVRIKTDKASASACRNLELGLKDDGDHTASRCTFDNRSGDDPRPALGR